jgi:hypothetical protein
VPALLHLPDGRAHTVATHQTLIHHVDAPMKVLVFLSITVQRSPIAKHRLRAS